MNSITAWHQKDIRKGIPIESGKFNVNFKQAGEYIITLRRWPKETQLPLNAEIDDAIPASKYWDEQKKGKSMEFDSAFIIIGGKEYKSKLNPSDHDVKFSIYSHAGKTTIESGFRLKNGAKTASFFTDINLKK